MRGAAKTIEGQRGMEVGTVFPTLTGTVLDGLTPEVVQQATQHTDRSIHLNTYIHITNMNQQTQIHRQTVYQHESSLS